MPKEQTAIEKFKPAGALVPYADLKQHEGVGTEGIGAGDVRPPRLTLAQSGHPQTKKNHEKYIPGLTEGDLFNDLTKEIYKPPVTFVVLRYLGKRAVEYFRDDEKKETGQTVKDPNVPLDDPRCQPTFDAKGKFIRPVADVFTDYLIFMPASAEIASLTFKNADLGRNGVGTLLNSMLKYPLKLAEQIYLNPPAWARTYRLGGTGKSDGVYNWAVYTLAVGEVAADDVRAIAASIALQYQSAKIVVEEPIEATPIQEDEEAPF